MKRILLAILPLFLFVALVGQNDEMTRNGGPVENGPIIININGYKVNPYKINKNHHDFGTLKFDMKDKLVSNGWESFPFDGNNNTEQNNGSTSENLGPQELAADNTDKSQKKVVEEVKNEMKVYPVPAVTNLKVDLGQEVNAEISLMNIIGQKVFTKKGEFSNLNISVSDYTSGTYFLMINIEDEMITKRVQIR